MTPAQPPIDWKSITIFSVMLGSMMMGVCAFSSMLERRDRERER